MLSAWSIPEVRMTCEGSELFDGTFLPAGQVKEITYGGVRLRCVGCGTCTPINESSSSSTIPSYTPHVPSYGTTSQQIAIGLMGAFLSGFFNTFFRSAFDTAITHDSRGTLDYEEQQRKFEEEKRKQEERKKQLLSQYNSLIAQAKKQLQPQSVQSNSQFKFQTLGGQLTPFQWQNTYPTRQEHESEKLVQKNLIKMSDINKIFGNVLQDKIMENIEEKIDDFGGKIIEKLDKKYGKDWGSKYYEKGLQIFKIAVTAKTEGIPQAGAEVIDYGISLIPLPNLTQEISDIGRKIYTRVAFTALDKFLTETEKACETFGLNCNKEEFWQNAESDMTTAQKIIYNWLGGR